MKRVVIILSIVSFNIFSLQFSIANETISSVISNNRYEMNDAERASKEWADKIKLGGYVIHFRHAQREQWIDVTAFDAFELASGIDASRSSFSRATCLTDQGKEEAKLLGKVMKLGFVSFSKVISSPSCRARQTAKLAFGKIDKIENSLLHRSAIPKIQHKEFDIELRSLLLSLKPKNGKNIALVGHVDTLQYAENSVLDPSPESNAISVESRDPTGFVVLEVLDGKVYARYVFRSMKDFTFASLFLPSK